MSYRSQQQHKSKRSLMASADCFPYTGSSCECARGPVPSSVLLFIVFNKTSLHSELGGCVSKDCSTAAQKLPDWSEICCKTQLLHESEAIFSCLFRAQCPWRKAGKMRLLKGQLTTNLLVWSVTWSVLMSSILSDDNNDDDDDDNGDDKMTVCQEEDNDLRVTCPLRPKPNYHTEFEFSMSKGKREIIINTNVSGTMPEPSFRHNTYVEQLEPYGFKLTMMRFTITENTTFMCKVTQDDKRLFVDVDALQPCSAISVLLQSYPWLLSLLLPFFFII
ncbi:uncharacterized protein LOC124398287 [Silurus meridionalis]|nr:uncharacterized protein LOC124398287 [Silurus meridionalis]